MIHAPIANSIINPPARLFKRFTTTERIVLDNYTITHENNHYKTHFSFRWVEATEMTEGEYQPLKGLITPQGHMTIKYNGSYASRPGDVREPASGDLLELNGELWIIESSQKIRNKSMRNLATIYLSLVKHL